ncbi:unnamed protein product [Albugo candida]|uniref:VASt domain-containing protein n=1 Tax=Albugo candida TaxID=65357 RepID=A0A024FW91_9STRA|nr:unnamed protein product [Albugo candida]|eukprot:CCI10919.1 unnamed protein product [Albugo candida]
MSFDSLYYSDHRIQIHVMLIIYIGSFYLLRVLMLWLRCYSFERSYSVIMDGKTRSARYRVPADAPLVPSTSLVDSVQCCKRPVKFFYIVETSTRIVDVPYGDHFSVIDRWTIMPIQVESGTGSHLQFELKVAFSKSTIAYIS